ncbi:MAG: ethylbenzene dehydrogenase-related protein [Ferruginibacter sp.]
MKSFQKNYLWIVATLVLSVGYISNCTKNDQVINLAASGTNTSMLITQKVATGPTVDGVVDGIWASAAKLLAVPQVPDPGNALFAGYQGTTVNVTLRSVYDGTYIYFLAEYPDSTKNKSVQPWYFDPSLNVAGKTGWVQEPNSRQFDVNGVLTREGKGTDQLAMLWNIDNSTAKFTAQTCYASCHLFTPYRNFAGVMVPNKSANHYTNGPNEKIDMWWLRLDKELANAQMDDEYQDWAGGPSVTDTVGGAGNGRHADDLVPPSPYSSSYINTNPSLSNGPFNNRVSLKLDGTGASVNVPAWIIPGAIDLPFIKASDTLAGGNARKITGVSSTGILTYTGGTIDPAIDPAYQKQAGVYGGVGSKCFPSFITAPYTMGRADFSAQATYTGSGWIVEWKRLLNTNSTLKQDIDFTKGIVNGQMQDQPFGLAIFNNSNYQHAIKPNLLLRFQQ